MAYEVGDKVMVDGEKCEVVAVYGGTGYMVETPDGTTKKVFNDQVSEVGEEEEEPEETPPGGEETGGEETPPGGEEGTGGEKEPEETPPPGEEESEEKVSTDS